MSEPIIVQRDRYDEPRCQRCGHSASYHSVTACSHGHTASQSPACDCKGWFRDEQWPPPIIIYGTEHQP